LKLQARVGRKDEMPAVTVDNPLTLPRIAGRVRGRLRSSCSAALREPIVHYGPFVMNSPKEINRAIEDYQAGRLVSIPADQLTPRNYA
jgi:hypothetical protein